MLGIEPNTQGLWALNATTTPHRDFEYDIGIEPTYQGLQSCT